MANNIDFKYLNNDTLDPICGLTVNYSVRVIAVLVNNKGGEEQARGAVYTSDVIIDGNETTDSDGIVTVDVINVFSDNTFLALWQKFNGARGYNVSIQITLESETQEISPYFYISRTDIPQMLSAYNVTFNGEDYSYPDLEYYTIYSPFLVSEIVIDEEILKSIQAKKLETQRKYINSLEDFQNEIVSQSILQIPVLNEYNPINITQIITRCLELSVGTIENGLTYTTDAGLVAQTNRLNKIKTLVNQISNLYPTITIEDGEGIPYQNVGVIPEPFRGIGFYQDGGDIIAFAVVLGDRIAMETWYITLNGEGINGTYGGFDKSFSYNLTEIFTNNNITLNVGDVIDIVVVYDKTNYFSKLIIKN
jgi:hypothetical protein